MKLIGEDLQYYPTPKSLVKKIWDSSDEFMRWHGINSILEPSAGCGELILNFLSVKYEDARSYGSRYYRMSTDVDCIELDQQRRQILKWEFSDERIKEFDGIDEDIRKDTNMKVVGDDFLKFNTYKKYDLILMNPPFEDGALHLLNAITLQSRGGKIICILNAETLRNPYSSIRKLLKQKLQELNAKVQYIEDAFLADDAIRKTDVEIAVVYIDIPAPQVDTEFLDRMKKAVQYDFENKYSYTGLVPSDAISRIIQEYDLEVKATVELMKIYHSISGNTVLGLCLGSKTYNIGINEVLKEVRRKYWKRLFSQKSIMSKFTTKIREQYTDMIQTLEDYDFTPFNIEQVLADIGGKVIGGIENAIFDLFDKLTSEHSWYPETSKNIHYFNGWKTNKAHCIGNKSIIPTWGIFSKAWDGKTNFNESVAIKTIKDIERVFDYLSGNVNAVSDLDGIISEAAEAGKFSKIECKYFVVDLYKKGTMHIKYKDPELVRKLNIYAAQNKKWLPPNYGKVKYEDMTAEEQDVIDSFQGKESYEQVLENKQFYLSGTPQNIFLLGA